MSSEKHLTLIYSKSIIFTLALLADLLQNTLQIEAGQYLLRIFSFILPKSFFGVLMHPK